MNIEIYNSLKTFTNSNNEHPYVVGTSTILKTDSGWVIRVCKEEHEPFHIRHENTLYLEPYEYGYAKNTQVENVIIEMDNGRLSIDIEINSNVVNKNYNFNMENITLWKEGDLIHIQNDERLVTYDNIHFVFMDKRILNILFEIQELYNDTN